MDYFKALTIFILTLICIDVNSCTNSSESLEKSIPDITQLRFKITGSIEIPFREADTIIYESQIGVCGNSSEEELNRLYIPAIDEPRYYPILKQKVGKVILRTGTDLNALMEKQCNGNADSLSVWDCFSKEKITMRVTGEIITIHKLKIYESYTFNGKACLITKLFTYSNGKWRFKTIGRPTRYRI